MNSSRMSEIVKILKEIYPSISIQMKSVEYNGLISIFIAKVDSNEQLDEHWDKISGSIASYYQSYLDDDYEKWNIYILYIAAFEVEQSIKYKIENDRFSCRKIVIDKYDQEVNDINVETLIIQNITNRDLVLSPTKKVAPPRTYSSDSIVWDLIKSSRIKSGKGSAQEAGALLDKISNMLRNEN